MIRKTFRITVAIGALAISLGLFGVPSLARAAGPDASADASRDPAATGADLDEEAAKAEGEGDAPKATSKKKPVYKKSRLTRDESEVKADKRFILLNAGEDKTVDLDFQPDTDRQRGFTIGNPAIVALNDVILGEKRQIVFHPLKKGETTVTVRDSDGNIRVIFTLRITDGNLYRAASEIKDLLRDVEGLSIRVVGPKVVIEGEVLVPSDYAKLLTVIQDKAYAGFVMNLTTISNVALQFLAKKIQTDIKNFAPNVTTRVVNGFIFLEGNVDTRDQAKKAQDIAFLYIPDPRPGNPLEREDSNVVKIVPGRQLVWNFIVVNPPPPKKLDKLVRVTVHFVELKKDYQKIFGFKWQPGFNPNAGQDGQPTVTVSDTKSSGTSFTAVISNLFPKLQSASSAGFARIIKTGTVVVRSGDRASLNEATQFSYNQITPNGLVSAQREDVGLKVGVTPQILGQSEDIEMDLNMVQKNLVGRAPANGAPPITATHEVQSKLYVRSNESAAVAQVISASAGTDFNKDPGREIQDPLFTLMHTKAYRKERSQFVIFVTPQIVESASEGTEDMKRNFRVKVK